MSVASLVEFKIAGAKTECRCHHVAQSLRALIARDWRFVAASGLVLVAWRPRSVAALVVVGSTFVGSLPLSVPSIWIHASSVVMIISSWVSSTSHTPVGSSSCTSGT